ncbi:hypothetical protein BVY04_00285 [bacterium M21]|nr:hypothetical protein BVY04_00285 [bacterium M21]
MEYIMSRLVYLPLVLVMLLMGCTTTSTRHFSKSAVSLGDSEHDIVGKLGLPDEVSADSGDRLLIYREHLAAPDGDEVVPMIRFSVESASGSRWLYDYSSGMDNSAPDKLRVLLVNGKAVEIYGSGEESSRSSHGQIADSGSSLQVGDPLKKAVTILGKPDSSGTLNGRTTYFYNKNNPEWDTEEQVVHSCYKVEGGEGNHYFEFGQSGTSREVVDLKLEVADGRIMAIHRMQ